MDSQHKLIKGYRDLTPAEISLMNEGKDLAEQVREWLDKVIATPDVDLRAAAIGKTELQTGFMWVVRAVAKPETF